MFPGRSRGALAPRRSPPALRTDRGSGCPASSPSADRPGALAGGGHERIRIIAALASDTTTTLSYTRAECGTLVAERMSPESRGSATDRSSASEARARPPRGIGGEGPASPVPSRGEDATPAFTFLLASRFEALRGRHARLPPDTVTALAALAEHRRTVVAADGLSCSSSTLRRHLSRARRRLGLAGEAGEPRGLALWVMLHARCCLGTGRPSLAAAPGAPLRTACAGTRRLTTLRALLLVAHALGFPTTAIAAATGRSPDTIRCHLRAALPLHPGAAPETRRWLAASWTATHLRCCLRRVLS